MSSHVDWEVNVVVVVGVPKQVCAKPFWLVPTLLLLLLGVHLWRSQGEGWAKGLSFSPLE